MELMLVAIQGEYREVVVSFPLVDIRKSEKSLVSKSNLTDSA